MTVANKKVVRFSVPRADRASDRGSKLSFQCVGGASPQSLNFVGGPFEQVAHVVGDGLFASEVNGAAGLA